MKRGREVLLDTQAVAEPLEEWARGLGPAITQDHVGQSVQPEDVLVEQQGGGVFGLEVIRRKRVDLLRCHIDHGHQMAVFQAISRGLARWYWNLDGLAFLHV